MTRPFEQLAPLYENPVAWKMIGTWHMVARLSTKTRRATWARITGLDELAITRGEPVVLQFVDDGEMDESALRFVRTMMSRQMPPGTVARAPREERP